MYTKYSIDQTPHPLYHIILLHITYKREYMIKYMIKVHVQANVYNIFFYCLLILLNKLSADYFMLIL